MAKLGRMRPEGSSILSLDIFHRLPLGVMIFDAGQALIFANPTAERLLGNALDQGSRLDRLVEALGPGCTDLVKMKAGQRLVVLSRGSLLEVECQDLDGHTLWLLDDKSEELRLRSQIAEEASLLAHGNDAFMVVDQQGLVRYANAVCEREMGYGPGTLVGLNLGDLQRASGDSFEEDQEGGGTDVRSRLRGVAREGNVLRYNAWQRRSDGVEYPVEVSVRPYRMGQEQVLLTTIRDESRRLQHLQDLMSAKAVAEAANRSKSAFLAITSHELRTPLTSIIGFCDLLSLEYGDQVGNHATYLKLISESSRSLLNIINDILDLSKIEAKTMEIKVEPVNPDLLLDLLAELWRPRAEAKGLELERRPSEGASRPFYSDPLRLRQVLDNLLNNAVKFTSQGAIELSLVHNVDDLVFTVQDTGKGIPPELHKQLFQPFWQMADATTRAAGGTGLGLYICRQIVQLLGGTIWLDTQSDYGTSFKVRLPRNVEGQTGLHRALSEPIDRKHSSGLLKAIKK